MIISLTQPVSQPVRRHLITSLFCDISVSGTACPHVHTTSMKCNSLALCFLPVHVSEVSIVKWLFVKASICGIVQMGGTGNCGKEVGELCTTGGRSGAVK